MKNLITNNFHNLQSLTALQISHFKQLHKMKLISQERNKILIEIDAETLQTMIIFLKSVTNQENIDEDFKGRRFTKVYDIYESHKELKEIQNELEDITNLISYYVN